MSAQARPDSALVNAVRLSRLHLLSLLLPMYVFSFLDRTNIGFAKQAFQASTGLSDAAYAFGAGLFFVTYALFEIPSNLILHRAGARRWMTRIMITWGLASAAMIFAKNPSSFYLLRALLGASEAGFFPGVVLYLTYWFPRQYIGQMMGLFYFGAPLAFIFGGPVSGLLLEVPVTWGLQGWQWMFLIEGLLASIVGVMVFFLMDDKPSDAAWLPEAEREALVSAIAQEDASKTAHSFESVVWSPRLLLLAAIYFLIQMSVYGVVFYLPSQIAGLLHQRIGVMVGLVSSIPWLCALLATWFVPRLADRIGNYRVVAASALTISAISIAISATRIPALGLVALCFAAAGFMSVQPLFWTFPAAYLGGSAAAGGLALINSLGTLGGFVAPNIKNQADVVFGSPYGGLCILSCTAMFAGLLILFLQHQTDSYHHFDSSGEEYL